MKTTTTLKYVINSENIPILFGKDIIHNTIGQNVKSAGFLIIKYDFNKDKFIARCFGSSETLNIKSNPKIDNSIIESFLNGMMKFPIKEALI